MNGDKAKKIFLETLPELSEPLKGAVEFVLSNWHKLKGEPRTSDIAIKFFARLSDLPTNTVDLKLAAKPNSMAKLLRNDPSVWYSFEDLPHEEWRNVVGYEGLYQVSNYGRIKSFRHNYPRIIRADKQSKGYLQLRLHRNGKAKNFGAHILVAQAFIGNPENKREVDHRNGDKTNNCVWNLDWATRSENAARAYQLGLIKVYRGTQSHYAKLTAEEVIYIRGNPARLKSSQLAEKFNVSRATINRIKSGTTYKNVT
ncbi:MAG: HNH endonuclease [Quinella sp. 3Q1]|nr:HNH endonuclease [Quinella sp. 3Q1]MBR3050558.1 HNH endonuclease [Selenomonadaceae bacterium]